MAGGGPGGDAITVLRSASNVVTKKYRELRSRFFNSFILSLHLWVMPSIWSLCFSLSSLSWFYKTPITCVSGFNAAAPVRMDIINICYTYPRNTYPEAANGSLLFYKYVPYSFLGLVGFYTLLWKVVKVLEPMEFRNLGPFLNRTIRSHNVALSSRTVETATNMMCRFSPASNFFYYKYVICHIAALVFDICTLFFLNFLIGDYFLDYGYAAFPYKKDGVNYQDHMSRVFPPFTTCTLTKHHQLVNERTEVYKCFLQLMPLYEKLFLILWFVLYIIIFATLLYIIYILGIWIQPTRRFFVNLKRPVEVTPRAAIRYDSSLQFLQHGEIFLLFKFGQYMSGPEFYYLVLSYTTRKALHSPAN